MTDRADAWDELHAATPPGWWVGPLRRFGAVILAAAAVAACEMLFGPTEADGQIVVNTGHLDGQQWVATAIRTGNRVCMSVEHLERHDMTSCVDLDPDKPAVVTGPQGLTLGRGRPTVVQGVAAPDVARVEVVTSTGRVDIPLVSLAAVGLTANAYAVAVPESPGGLILIQSDAAGNELYRGDFGD